MGPVTRSKGGGRQQAHLPVVQQELTKAKRAPQQKQEKQPRQAQDQKKEKKSRQAEQKQPREAQGQKQQKQAPARPLVFGLVLSHSDLHSQSATICRLLCVSKGVTQAIKGACIGALAVTVPSVDAETCQNLLPWLSKHAKLLKTLKLSGVAGRGPLPPATAAVAGALEAAPGLHLLQYEGGAEETMLNLLGRCTSLTSLNLDLNGTRAPELPAITQGLKSLSAAATQLRTLTLSPGARCWDDPHDFPKLLSEVLPGLTQLTSLHVDRLVDSGGGLNKAPPQLVELSAVASDFNHTSALELGHLTACTRLQLLLDADEGGWRVITESDVLPPNLLSLHVSDCDEVAPVLKLKQLSQLTIGPQCCTEAGQLKQLKGLKGLKQLALGYSGDENTRTDHSSYADSAAAWPGLPALMSLELNGAEVDAEGTLFCLQKVKGLTQLQLDHAQVNLLSLAKALPDKLQHLTLRSLVEDDSGDEDSESEEDEDEEGTSKGAKPGTWEKLMARIGNLQQLTSLDLGDNNLLLAEPELLAPLSKLSKLQQLEVCQSEYGDTSGVAKEVAAMQKAGGLPKLTSFKC